jgi:hypothetical protein
VLAQYDVTSILHFTTRLIGSYVQDGEDYHFIDKFIVSEFPHVVLYDYHVSSPGSGELVSATLLELALQKQNQSILQAVLKCWIRLLNTDIQDSIDIYALNYQHASCKLSTRHLIALAQIYPTEFEDFVSSLRLVHPHSHVISDVPSRLLLSFENPLLVGMSEFYVKQLWKEQLTEQKENLAVSSTAIPITAYVIPLPFPAHVQMLQTYLDIVERTKSYQVFESELVIHAVEFAWIHFGKTSHFRAPTVYLFHGRFQSEYVLLSEKSLSPAIDLVEFSGESLSLPVWTHLVNSVLILTVFSLAFDEMQQAIVSGKVLQLSKRQFLLNHFSDP